MKGTCTHRRLQLPRYLWNETFGRTLGCSKTKQSSEEAALQPLSAEGPSLSNIALAQQSNADPLQ